MILFEQDCPEAVVHGWSYYVKNCMDQIDLLLNQTAVVSAKVCFA